MELNLIDKTLEEKQTTRQINLKTGGFHLSPADPPMRNQEPTRLARPRHEASGLNDQRGAQRQQQVPSEAQAAQGAEATRLLALLHPSCFSFGWREFAFFVFSKTKKKKERKNRHAIQKIFIWIPEEIPLFLTDFHGFHGVQTNAIPNIQDMHQFHGIQDILIWFFFFSSKFPDMQSRKFT